MYSFDSRLASLNVYHMLFYAFKLFFPLSIVISSWVWENVRLEYFSAMKTPQHHFDAVDQKKKINENENDMIIIWKASNKKWYACIKISTKWFQPFERKRTTINNNKRMDHIFICWNEQSIRNRKPEDDYGFETPASVCYFECGQKNTAPGLGGLGWNGIFRSKCILLTLYWNESHRNSRPNSISE